MKTTLSMVAIAAMVALTGLATAPYVAAHANATGIVKERMDNFKASQGHLKAISRLLGSAEFDEIISRASAMREWGMAMAAAFPEGSGGAPSDAAPAIWTDNAGFVAAARQPRCRT
jgi:cytochrome c556